MKKISIIMPNFNHAPFLRERLDSIFAQDYANKEVILLDDASTDESRAVLEEYATRLEVKHVILNDTNSGNTFAQWQRGFSLATGEYIWIAESDDVAQPHFLSRLVEALEREDAVVAFARSRWIDECGAEIVRKQDKHWQTDFAMDGRRFVVDYLLGYNYICNASAVLFRRSALGGVDMEQVKQYSASGDRLFWISLAMQGRVAYIADQLSNFRQHTQKVSGPAQATGRNIIQDYAIYQHIAPLLHLSVIDRLQICGYHRHAMYQQAVSEEGRKTAAVVWSAEPCFGRIARLIYIFRRIVEKTKR